MDLGLKDTVVVVTGGAKGIGAAVVELCAAEGAIPVIVDRDAAAASEIRQRLQKSGLKSESVIVDLTDHEASRQAFTKVAEKLGRIDALVNNAGYNDGVRLEDGTAENFMRSLLLNSTHCFTITKAALPYLVAARGAIVNVGSKVAITGQGGTSGYAAAKGALLGFTSEWANELAKDRVRVNILIPAEVMTPQYRSWLNKTPDPIDAERRIASKIPMGHRLTSPQEIASAVVFLLSPSNKMSGERIFIDGGYVHLDRGIS